MAEENIDNEDGYPKVNEIFVSDGEEINQEERTTGKKIYSEDVKTNLDQNTVSGSKKTNIDQSTVSDSKKENQISFKDLLYSSAVHSIVIIFDKNSSWIRRLLWVLLLLGAISYCCKGFFDLYEEYVNHDSFISTKYIYEKELRYPALTVCPGFNKRKMGRNNPFWINRDNNSFLDYAHFQSYNSDEFLLKCTQSDYFNAYSNIELPCEKFVHTTGTFGGLLFYL